jgi:hypothetical protein
MLEMTEILMAQFDGRGCSFTLNFGGDFESLTRASGVKTRQ